MMPVMFNTNNSIMTTNINPFEHAIRNVVRELTDQQLTKRVPDIPVIDYRRLTFFLIEDRITVYKDAEIHRTLDAVLLDFGITSRQTYYNWYEKYHRYYQAI